MMILAAKRMIAPSSAFTVAVGLHVLMVATLLSMPRPEMIPPVALGGFEVVDLSAFGVTAEAEREPESLQPIEEAKVEPESEPVPVREYPVEETMVRQEAKPVVMPKSDPKPTPTPEPVKIFKPKRKPVEKSKPVEVTKEKTKRVEKPKPVEKTKAQTKPRSEASVGSQNAFVPPKSNAAYLKNPKPAYPKIALRRGMQGLVLLNVQVSPKGLPLSVLVKRSSGFVLLDKAALEAVKRWRFAPATRGGIPVMAKVDVPIRFSLKDA